MTVLRTIATLFIGLLLIEGADAAKPAKIEWAAAEARLEGYPGHDVGNVYFFEVTEPLSEVTFDLTPSLQHVARVETSALKDLEPGIEYSVQVTVSLPEDWVDRMTRGVIQGRDDAGVVANPVTAIIEQLAEPPMTDLPRTEADAILSPRQVVLDPTLGGIYSSASDDTRYNFPHYSAYFRLDEGFIDPDINRSAVFRNGILMDRSRYELTANYLRVPSQPPGRNEYIVELQDQDGQIAVGYFVIWAVDQTTNIDIKDRYGRYIYERFEVTATPLNGDEVSISDDGLGSVRLKPLPYNVPFLITAREVYGNRVASMVYRDTCGYCTNRVTLRVLETGEPSTVDNNDFSLGTSGWTTTGARRLSLLDHGDLPPGFETGEALWLASFLGGSRAEMQDTLDWSGVEAKSLAPAPMAIADADIDLAIRTDGTGLQFVTRTFETEPGTRAVRVRYRFASFEVANGYYGTEFNDYFAITAANSGGETVSDSRSMNELGYDFFTPAGVGPWQEMVLPVNKEDGDVVVVEVGVANVVDPYLHSYIIVDLIDEIEIEVAEVEFNDEPVNRRAPGPLAFFSFDDHPYNATGGGRFADGNGNAATEVHGTFRLEGPEDVTIERVVLEVLRAGEVIAEVDLREEHEEQVLRAFDEQEVIEVADAVRLFDVPVADNPTGAPERAQLRLRVEADNGDRVTEQYAVVPILVRHDVAADDRYLCCNATAAEPDGGDDWIRPDLRWLPRYLAENHGANNLVVGDTSNMNGGVFYPHTGHRDGRHSDVDFDGYDNLDANAAQVIIDILNDETLRPHIAQILVWCGDRAVDAEDEPEYDEGNPNEFCTTFSTTVLGNGQRADEYTEHHYGHWNHPHFTWQ